MTTERLITAYRNWRNAPFPPGSTQDEIDEAHAELATIDYWVADMVVPFVEDAKVFPLKVDIVGAIERLRAHLLNMHGSSDQEHQPLIDQYSTYLDLLDDVFDEYGAASGR